MTTKVRDTKKEYSFCKSLIFAIQNITKQKTHEILGTLVAEAEKACIEYEAPIDVDYLHNEKRVKKYIYYPGTKLYMGVYVTITSRSRGYWNSKDVPKGKNLVEYSFKLPQSYVKLDAQEFEDIALDGILTDESFDLDEPSVKNPKTPAQKREEEEARKQQQALERAHRDAKRRAKRAARNLP